jgi:uncharacterized membrane protein YgcG
MNALGGDPFDLWLGQELKQHAQAQGGPSPMPAQAQYHTAYLKGMHMPFLAKVAAVLTTKAAIAVTAGVVAVGAASVSEAVITGSVNPADWGKQVVQQVQKCEAALAPGTHGIGQCVSSFASQHGKQVSSQHRATPTPGHGHSNGNGNGNGGGGGNGKTPGPPANKVHPTPPGKVHPTPPNNRHK